MLYDDLGTSLKGLINFIERKETAKLAEQFVAKNPHNMTSAAIPNCCGGILLHGFGYDMWNLESFAGGNGNANADPKDIEAFLDWHIKCWHDQNKSFLIVYFNEKQVERIAPIFAKRGFKPVVEELKRPSFERSKYANGQAHTISIWIRELQKV